MMAGALNGTVCGYLAKDPERRGEVVSLSIPVSKGRDKPTTWVRVACFKQTADFAEQYLRKGTFVTCTGRMELREWESNGKKGSSLEMAASDVTAARDESGGQRSNGRDDNFGEPPRNDHDARRMGGPDAYGRGSSDEDSIPF